MARAVTTEAEDLLSYSVGRIVNAQFTDSVLEGWKVVSETTISSAVAQGMRDGMNANISDTSTAGHPDFRFIDFSNGEAYVFGLNCNYDGDVISVVLVYLAEGTNYHLAFAERRGASDHE